MNDQQIQGVLARLMIWGVVIAAAVMLVGLTAYLATHLGASPGDHLFSGEPMYLESIAAMARHALDFGAPVERRSIIGIGIVLLLLNPFVRVAFAALGFAVQRDWLYTCISMVVFSVLLFSFFW